MVVYPLRKCLGKKAWRFVIRDCWQKNEIKNCGKEKSFFGHWSVVPPTQKKRHANNNWYLWVIVIAYNGSSSSFRSQVRTWDEKTPKFIEGALKAPHHHHPDDEKNCCCVKKVFVEKMFFRFHQSSGNRCCNSSISWR